MPELRAHAFELAPGRLPNTKPVSVIDIGSNSVRLVVYEGLSRVPAPLFNEKILAGLGKHLATTGIIAPEAFKVALNAIKRFMVLSKQLEAHQMHVLATAAVRDAKNGAEFTTQVEKIIGAPLHIISGEKEAELAALGVVSGFINPLGVVGDLGGGSVELVPVNGRIIDKGESLPLGGLRLAEINKSDPKKTEQHARKILKSANNINRLQGKTFYAVGGSWRSLAKLHMAQKNYPLRVMHHYTISAKEALEFCRLVAKSDINTLPNIEAVSNDRRTLLPFGALVLAEIISHGKPANIIFSALGVREGLLYSLLSPEKQSKDPLIYAAEEFALLRSRSPKYVHELCDWTDKFINTLELAETNEDKRLRHAACLLSDLSWRAHPDYRGDQSFNIIANAAFIGVTHKERAFLSLTAFYRHAGFNEIPPISALVSILTLERQKHARILGALIRTAHAISACMPDILLKTHFVKENKKLFLVLPPELADLAIQRLKSRAKQLSKLLNIPFDVLVNINN